MAHPIPTRLDEFTPALVGAALGEAGIGASVSDVRVEPMAVGEGFLGDLARLHVTYTDPAAPGPTRLVAKIPTGDEGLKPLGVMLGVYEREARFYAEVAPSLQVRVPRCFYNEFDTDAESYALLLEDVGHLRPGDQLIGATLDDAQAVMRAAAGLHRRWWQSDRLDELDWVPPIDSPLNLGLQDLFAAGLPAIADEYGAVLGDQLLGHLEEFVPTIREFVGAYAGHCATLVHNDFRLDNMFFSDELTLIDWQIIGKGDGTGDFVPFLAANLDVEMRRAHELDLLRSYLDLMHEAEAGFADLDDLLTAYRGSLMFWTVAWCNNAVTAVKPNDRAHQMFDRAVERMAAAATDHTAWEMTGDFSAYPGPRVF